MIEANKIYIVRGSTQDFADAFDGGDNNKNWAAQAMKELNNREVRTKYLSAFGWVCEILSGPRLGHTHWFYDRMLHESCLFYEEV